MSKPRLNQLVGKPLAIARHAADMLVLHFGEIRREKNKSWGELALHVQSPWRFVLSQNTFFGKDDRYSPIKKVANWDKWYQEPHPNLEQACWLGLLGKIDFSTKSIEATKPSLIVKDVEETHAGDLTIQFKNGFKFQTFACGTKTEFWRLFIPGLNKRHLVRENKLLPRCVRRSKFLNKIA
jgi:hypothetical protein